MISLSLIAALFTSLGSQQMAKSPNLLSLKAVRAELASLERQLKARPKAPSEQREKLEESLEFFKMREYLLTVRSYPAGVLDPLAYQRAIEHKKKMPALVKSQDIGTGWTFFGPRNLTGGGNMGIGPLAGRINAVAYDPVSPNTTFWVGGATGGVSKTTDFGDSFSILADKWDYLYTSDIEIDPNNRNRVYVATGDYPGWWGYGIGIMRSTNGGSSWSNVLRNELNGNEVSDILVSPINSNIVLATAGRGTSSYAGAGIWRSTDYGQTWSKVSPSLSYAKLAVSMPTRDGGRYFYAAPGNGGQLKRSSDEGLTWTDVLSLADLSSVATSTEDYRIVYVFDSTNRVLKSTNAGSSWSDITDNFDPADFRQTTFNYTFGVINSEADGSGSDLLVLGLVDFFVYAGGSWTRLYRNGNNRTVHPDYHGFAQHPTKKNRALISNDGGVWEIYFDSAFGIMPSINLNKSIRMTDHVYASYHPDASNNPDYALTGMWHNGSGVSTGDPWNWKTVLRGDGMYTAIDDQNPALQFTTIQGLGYDSDTNMVNVYGTTNQWSSSTALNTTPLFFGENFAFITPWDEIPGELGALYIAGQSLYKLKWTGGSATWTKDIGDARFGTGNEAALAVTAIPTANDGVFVGTSTGRLFGSSTPSNGVPLLRNFGIPITSISASKLDPDDILVSLGNAGAPGETGGLWLGKDVLGGSPTWTNVSGSGSTSLPDIGVNWVVRDPYDQSNIWYAATDIGVFYTDDAGNNWYVATESLGLPNAMVLHLATSDNYLYAATFGRGMWRMQLYSTRPKVTGFTINLGSVTGGNNIPATVTLDRPAPPGGILVNFKSSDPSTIPDSNLPIFEGNTSQNFTLATEQPVDTKTVTLTASANGGSAQDSVLVYAVSVTGLAIANTVGGNTVNATITLDRDAPYGGAKIDLADNSSLVQFPASFTIPSGDSSGVVYGTSNLTSIDRTVTVQATRPGSGVQDSFILYAVTVASVTLVPPSVWNTQGFAVRVSLSRPAPLSGFPLNLDNGMPNVLVLPASYQITYGVQTVDIPGGTKYVPSDVSAGIRVWDPYQNYYDRSLFVKHLGISEFTIVPKRIIGGRSARVSVILDRIVDKDITIAISQQPNVWAQLPQTIKVLAGTDRTVIDVPTSAVQEAKITEVTALLGTQEVSGAFKKITVSILPLRTAPPK